MTRRVCRSMALMALSLLLAMLLAACGDEEPTPAPTMTPTPALEEVSLALDWFPNSNHAGFYAAQERGYFRDEGLEVNIYVPANPEDVLKTVGAGRDDFGVSYQAEVLLARGEGVPVKSVAAMVQHPLNSIMVLTESGITRPGELKGKKVGVTGIPFEEALFQAMLEYEGLTIDDVTIVNVGYDLGPSLIGRKVDAIVGAYWTHESILLEMQGYPITIMRMEDWGVPDFYELVLVASEDMISQSPGHRPALCAGHGQGLCLRNSRSTSGGGHPGGGQPGDGQGAGDPGHRAAGAAVDGGGAGLRLADGGALGEPGAVDEGQRPAGR